MQRFSHIKCHISNHCSNLPVRAFVPHFNSEFGSTLIWCLRCHCCLPYVRTTVIPLVWMASDRLKGVFLNTNLTAFIASGVICSLNPIYLFLWIQSTSTLKNEKYITCSVWMLDVFSWSMLIRSFKKDVWVIIGLISGNCIYWHQRKLQFFTKGLMTWGLVAFCLSQTGCSH